MITELSEEATEFGRHALRAFESVGGDKLALRAFAEPDKRAALQKRYYRLATVPAAGLRRA